MGEERLPEIDEKFFPFFVDYGLVELGEYLAKVARFQIWLEINRSDQEALD